MDEELATLVLPPQVELFLSLDCKFQYKIKIKITFCYRRDALSAWQAKKGERLGVLCKGENSGKYLDKFFYQWIPMKSLHLLFT